jgi:hypothetical protein
LSEPEATEGIAEEKLLRQMKMQKFLLKNLQRKRKNSIFVNILHGDDGKRETAVCGV